MTVIEFKTEMRRLDFKYDPWGEAMNAFFECAARLHKRNAVIPVEWQYRPAPCPDNTDKENYWYALFGRSGNNQLLQIGALLHRYTMYLRKKGKDY